MTDTTELPTPPSKVTAGAAVATASLVLIALLAFDPFRLVLSSGAERLTLLFLAVCAAAAVYTPLKRHFEHLDAATFVFAAAWFTIYALARRAGPDEGWHFSLPTATGIEFKIAYATRIAVAGAVLAAALNRTSISGFTRAALAAMLFAAMLLLGNYMHLSQFFKIGEGEQLDPVPLTHALMQLMEYAAVTALCGIAAANETTRRLLLKGLPIVLLALWARYQFAAVPAEEEDE